MTHPAIGGIRLVLGGNVFGWTADRDASFAVLDAFVAGGGRMIDTADVYSAWVPGHTGGESEVMLGAWLRARRGPQDVLIHTKVGLLPGEGGNGLAPARVAAAIDASLDRLGVEQVALYYAHRDEENTTLEDSLAAFDGLVKSGKVAALGASNFTAPRLAEALQVAETRGLTPFTALQPEYNLVARDTYAGALQDYAVAHALPVFPYYSLAAGFLTGKYRGKDDATGARGGSAGRYLNENGLAVLGAMDAVASETQATLAQIALAWLNAQPGISAPIASATNVAQAEQLIAATQLVLTADQLARLDAAGG